MDAQEIEEKIGLGGLGPEMHVRDEQCPEMLDLALPAHRRGPFTSFQLRFQDQTLVSGR
ncbi:hypothetical protein D3C87_2006420 [compost metagenome]